MRELLDGLARWRAEGRRVVLGRVIDVAGSGPRQPGAAMAVDADGEVLGSVSGGCVEAAVVSEALEVLRLGEPRIVSFGYSDDEAIAVGLTCGGTVVVHLSVLEWWDGLEALAAEVHAGRPAALATVVEGPRSPATIVVRADGTTVGTSGDPDLDRVVTRDALGALAAGTTALRHYGSHGEAREETVSVFVECFAAPPRMIVFGAVDFTGALVRVAKLLGYHVTVCDARATFATAARFPEADAVVVDWPQRYLEALADDPDVVPLGGRDAVCVLTHDAKFDVPAVRAALATGVGYLGAMGSRRTQADRLRRLRADGVDDEALRRLHAPIGLDLGARTPEEVAVSILAEVIAARTGRGGASLRDTAGPLH